MLQSSYRDVKSVLAVNVSDGFPKLQQLVNHLLKLGDKLVEGAPEMQTCLLFSPVFRANLRDLKFFWKLIFFRITLTFSAVAAVQSEPLNDGLIGKLVS